MFDLLNDIEDCPATLLSANRHFISKCDARLLIQSDGASSKNIHKLDNYVFSLLLFSDLIMVNILMFSIESFLFARHSSNKSILLQLCKKRTSIRRANSLRERTSTAIKKATKKSYKYIETIDLSLLKFIYEDFDDTGIFVTFQKIVKSETINIFVTENLPDSENAFMIVTLPLNLTHFVVYPFVVIKESELKKQQFIADTLKAHEIMKQNQDVYVRVCFPNCKPLSLMLLLILAGSQCGNGSYKRVGFVPLEIDCSQLKQAQICIYEDERKDQSHFLRSPFHYAYTIVRFNGKFEYLHLIHDAVRQ